MLKNKRIIFILTIAIMIFTSIVFATEDTPFIPADKIDLRRENIIMFGDEVLAEGEAHDLIILAGKEIISTANGGYSFIAGDEIDITGENLNDTFAFGNEINVRGKNGRDLFVFGKEITIAGEVNRNVYVLAKELKIESTAIINGEVNATSTPIITVQDGATILNGIKYQSIANAKIPSDIKAQIIEVEEQEKIDPDFLIENPIVKIINVAVTISINIIFFGILLLIFPAIFSKVSRIYDKKGVATFGTSIGWGILMLVVVPIAVLMLLCTIVGAPIAIVALIAYCAVIVMSTIFAGYLLGVALFRKTKFNKLLMGILGIILLGILYRIPVVGGITRLLAISSALGLILHLGRKDKDDKGNIIEAQKVEDKKEEENKE